MFLVHHSDEPVLTRPAFMFNEFFYSFTLWSVYCHMTNSNRTDRSVTATKAGQPDVSSGFVGLINGQQSTPIKYTAAIEYKNTSYFPPVA